MTDHTDHTEPPDRPRVDELEVGDMILTVNLEGSHPGPLAVVVENSPMTNPRYCYLGAHPLGAPGAITRYPELADTRVTRRHRGGTHGQTFPDFLEAVAALLRQVPEIPHYPRGLHYSLGQDIDDVDAVDTLRAAHEALTAAGVDHRFENNSRDVSLVIIVGGRRFEVSHVHAASWAEHQAQRSYEDNVQVDAAGGA